VQHDVPQIWPAVGQQLPATQKPVPQSSSRVHAGMPPSKPGTSGRAPSSGAPSGKLPSFPRRQSPSMQS